MNILVMLAALILVFSLLQDVFETIVLPRRVTRKLRLTRLFYRFSWRLWSFAMRRVKSSTRRDNLLSLYGPFSLLLLLVLWAMSLIAAFALLQWSCGSSLTAPEHLVSFWTDLYMSGTTFFTLGLGDVIPREGLPRLFTVTEGGLGIAFFALVIGYVPVIYQAFSRREIEISLLDARAGSPPSAAEMVRRHIEGRQVADELISYLRGWEHWCADLLESHLSYPMLMYYRSQHERQSWVAALTTVLDVSALVMIEMDGVPAQIGRFTFAIARHAAVDLTQSLNLVPVAPKNPRLTSEQFSLLAAYLRESGFSLRDEKLAEQKLSVFRNLYEPYVNVLAIFLFTQLPEWVMSQETIDDWQTSAWDHFSLTTQRPLPRLKQKLH